MRVLLVEDDPLIGKATSRFLGLENYTVDWVTKLAQAQTCLKTHHYEAVLLDLGLPDGDGEQLLHNLRQSGQHTPVLVITARDALADRVQNLDDGADDFLIKPFDLMELAARLRVSLRRAKGRAEERISAGGLHLLPAKKCVVLQGQEIGLTSREFNILKALMGSPGEIFSRSQLEEVLYGWGEEVESNSIEVHVHNVRKKVGKRAIETVHGLGYKMGTVE